jgi:hypothetical protein
MARTSNREIITRYRGRIEQSRQWRREENYDDLWQRMINLYRGKHYRTTADEDRLLVNVAFATINVIGPSVSVNHPKITVNAKKFEDADRAVVTEAIVNYWWRHYDCQRDFRRAVKDMLILGHGWLKTGYRFVERTEGEYDFTDELADAAPESISESEVKITEDRPFVERISPFDVFVDPDATNMNDMRWIAQRIRRPLAEVKKDKRYNAAARQEASPSHYSKWKIDDRRKTRTSYEEQDGYVEIWEFYDIDRNKMSVFCDGGDKFLVSPVDIPFAFGHPFVMLRNYDIPDYFYPMGELEAIEPLQLELNETRTQMMNHRKRFSRKWLYKESAFDADGRSALESDEDNVMVPVVSEDGLSNVVVPMPAVISPPEFYNQSNLISSDIDRVSGVSEYMRGALPEIRRTATEAAIAQDAANARASDKLASIERTIADCARRLVMMAQQYMTGEQAIRVVGEGSMPAWLNFDRDYVQGEFDFDVEGGSTAPVNESFRRQMALQVVDAMAPFAANGIIDMPKLANYVLQYGFGIRNSASFVQEAPPPMMDESMMGGMPPEEGGGPVMPSSPMPGFPAGMEDMATGGMPMPSNIPPEILAQLLGAGNPLPNTALPPDGM